MVLHPRQPKITLLTVSATTTDASICRVVSPPTHEPTIAFSDVDRYEAWHDAMHEKIQALHSNDTWTLVPFHHLMNVVGYQWMYTIKHQVDDRIEMYKVRLVARGFTQQEGIDYSDTFILIIKQATVRLLLYYDFS
jgi:hypothetical protein